MGMMKEIDWADLLSPSSMCPWNAYMWILIVGCFTAFAFAWSIGANDVANAFGTSVGSKSLTLTQACVIAAVFEFTGALTLGGAVTQTIAVAIADPEAFSRAPEVYMYGMLCALGAAAMWVTLATYLEMAVSTTHSIIGGVIGFSLCWQHGNSINWYSPQDTFPYFSGVIPVITSWFTSPIISGILAFIHFKFLRSAILRRKNSVALAFWSLPLLVFKTIVVDLFFILLKGIGAELHWDTLKCLWIAIIAAAGSAVLMAGLGMPFLVWKFNRAIDKASQHQHAEQNAEVWGLPRMNVSGEVDLPEHPTPGDVMIALNLTAAEAVAEAEAGARAGAGAGAEPALEAGSGAEPAALPGVEASTRGGRSRVMAEPPPQTATVLGLWDDIIQRAENDRTVPAAHPPTWRDVIRTKLWKVRRVAMHGLVQDVHAGLEEDTATVAMHQAAEIFEPRAEMVFMYLQVISASCVSFAHGSNDVANAVGPVAAIWYIYQNCAVPPADMDTPLWVLVIGGSGIVIGLCTYGYNIIRAIGVKMAKMTPSRGYSSELAVALTVAVASAFGIPISTTHCIVGAEVAVGMCEDLRLGANWRLFAKTMVAWLMTMFVVGLVSAAIFSQGAYSPSIVQCKEINRYEDTMQAIIDANLKLINVSNGMHGQPFYFEPHMLAQFLEAGAHLCRGGQIFAKECTAAVQAADGMYKMLSLLAVGFNVSSANFTLTSVTVPALSRP